MLRPVRVRRCNVLSRACAHLPQGSLHFIHPPPGAWLPLEHGRSEARGGQGSARAGADEHAAGSVLLEFAVADAPLLARVPLVCARCPMRDALCPRPLRRLRCSARPVSYIQRPPPSRTALRLRPHTPPSLPPCPPAPSRACSRPALNCCRTTCLHTSRLPTLLSLSCSSTAKCGVLVCVCVCVMCVYVMCVCEPRLTHKPRPQTNTCEGLITHIQRVPEYPHYPPTYKHMRGPDYPHDFPT